MNRARKTLSTPGTWSFLGPWPLAPVVTFVATALTTAILTFRSQFTSNPVECLVGCVTVPNTLLAQFAAVGASSARIDPLIIIVFTLALASSTAFCVLMGKRLTTTDEIGRPPLAAFLSTLIISALIGSLAGLVAMELLDQATIWSSLPVVAFRIFVLLLVVHWIGGRLSYAYAQDALRVKETVASLTAQRSLLIQADERARREVADYLHDHVQADLLVLAMRLQNLSTQLPDAVGDEVVSIAAEVERVRRVGVRSAGRRLSPDIDALGLFQATSRLAESWSPAMDVSVDFSVEAQHALVGSGVPTHVSLSLYRVIEQSLLNAAAHGQSPHVAINVWLDDAEVYLTITDNGRGLTGDLNIEGQIIRGSGTALCDAWIDAVGGRWARCALAHGVQVSAVVPLKPAIDLPRLSSRIE